MHGEESSLKRLSKILLERRLSSLNSLNGELPHNGGKLLPEQRENMKICVGMGMIDINPIVSVIILT